MSEQQTFRLVHDTARHAAREAVRRAPEGFVCVVRPPNRTLDQNAALHSAFAELAKQCEWKGHRLDTDIWKRLCVAAWLRERGEQPEMIPALDSKGFDVIYERTSKLTVAQCSELLDWVYAFGAQNGVTFKERAA